METNKWLDIPNFICRQALLQKGDRVLVACSGGVDSIVLLHYLGAQRSRFGLELGAIHIDHSLRGVESAKDGEVVQLLAERLGVPCYREKVPVPELVKETGGNVQDICRTARYEKFETAMTEGNFNVLALAHHSEDQLETVLMQLAKGKRPKGMPVMRKLEAGKLVRPLLMLQKKELYEYAAVHELAFREDPSNAKNDYTRNRYRHNIVPALVGEQHDAAENAVRIASVLQEEDDFFNQLAIEQVKQIMSIDQNGLFFVYSEAFSAMHPALQKRVVPLLLKYLYDGENVPAIYNASLLNQLIDHLGENRGSASVHLPNGWMMQRNYGVSTFVRKEEKQGHLHVPFPENEWVHWGKFKFRWCHSSAVDREDLRNIFEWRYFLPAAGGLPSHIRTRLPGDRMRLRGMNTAKRLSRLFIDEKVPESTRDDLPIIVSKTNEIYAVPGIRYNELFSREIPGKHAYILMMDRID